MRSIAISEAIQNVDPSPSHSPMVAWTTASRTPGPRVDHSMTRRGTLQVRPFPTPYSQGSTLHLDGFRKALDLLATGRINAAKRGARAPCGRMLQARFRTSRQLWTSTEWLLVVIFQQKFVAKIRGRPTFPLLWGAKLLQSETRKAIMLAFLIGGAFLIAIRYGIHHGYLSP
ncbi:hypothetical protein [Rhizobium leguminosarum]|uniref:hypothetical protein n=1 Tax=Rhizobium leguminosarum TaxID=384 RepID=UPI001C8FFB11|nr:hypothetical protein [Rhizobium leguminosarum]MBY2909894.1 hypothetical protein [Rhizobium leguminosarum]